MDLLYLESLDVSDQLQTSFYSESFKKSIPVTGRKGTMSCWKIRFNGVFHINEKEKRKKGAEIHQN